MEEQKKQRKRGPGELFSFLTIRMEKDTLADLAGMAKEDGRSMSGYVRRIIARHVVDAKPRPCCDKG